MLVAALTVLCLTQLAQSTTDIRMPPRIVKGPVKELIFRTDGEVQLDCIAEGKPEPRYSWFKDGRFLEPKPNVVFSATGIIINQMSLFDEGYYQCRAENQYGVSISNTTSLRRAYLLSYISSTTIDYPNLEEGQPFVLKNIPTKGFPAPTFSWHIVESPTDNSPKGLPMSKRMQMDEEGNLHFSYLLTSDMQAGKLYKCNLLNPFVDLTAGGSYSRLHITPKGVKEFAPVKSFTSVSPVVAVLGRNATLRCFFSGYPDPSLTWSKVNSSMPMGRYSLLNHNSELQIRDIRQSDEGDYKCRGSNSANSGSFTDEIIQIDVQSVPSFTRDEDRPTKKNATEGDTAVFTCNATAEPPAKIEWLRNGEVLSQGNLPPRMRIISNGKQLEIINVCKDCSDGTRDTDLMVVQCNASNVHGYVFTDAYLNVLERTIITDRPQNNHLEFDKLSAEFYCAAKTDDSTPLTVSWFRVMDDGNPDYAVHSLTPHVTVSADGTRLSFQMTDDTVDQWPKFRGKYRCHATNGYSEDNVEVTLNVDDPPPTVPPVVVEYTEPEQPTTAVIETAPLVGASFADFWWILILVAVVLLFIIIVICCCVCCKRCKGDTYFVDKKERQDRKDPEKELIDNSLQPYHRRDPETLKGSRASLGDSMKGDSDEDDDLNEYGDIDAGKFTEDGSFIGDYADEQRKRGRDSVA